ncbi:MAG: formylglycine-generating enzyme family protein [Thermoguttaceae bacterium]|nr:formylglycine-generating enzyme family protein [Thermoguttaceae bacterium]
MGWYKGNSGGYNHDVGEKSPNAWGLYDMHGNVWEWCSDWFDSDTYDATSQTDPTGPSSGSYRVLRGGGWSDDAEYCRSARRNYIDPTNRNYCFGFRLVLGR